MANNKPGDEGKKKPNGQQAVPQESLQEKLEKAGEAHRKAAQDYEGEAAALGKTGKNGDAADKILKAKQKAEEHWNKAGKRFNKAGNIKVESGELKKGLDLFGEAAKCFAAAGNKELLDKKKKAIEATKDLMKKVEEERKKEEKEKEKFK